MSKNEFGDEISPYDCGGHRCGHTPRGRSQKLPTPPPGGTGEKSRFEALEIESRELANARSKQDGFLLGYQNFSAPIKMEFEKVEHARRNIECLVRLRGCGLELPDADSRKEYEKLFGDALKKNLAIIAALPDIKTS